MNRTEIEVESAEIGVRFICGGCRKGINYMQDICRGFKSILIWDGFDRPKRYTGEQTEPAE